MQLNRFMIRLYVEQALREEIGPGDTTGCFLVGDDPVQTAQIYAKGSGVACAASCARTRPFAPSILMRTSSRWCRTARRWGRERS